MPRVPRLNASTVTTDVVLAAGGLDVVTPPVYLPPGVLIDGVNFVARQNGGYRRIAGYERFDGTQAPSGTSYIALVLDGISGAVDGDTLTVVATGATYTLLGSSEYEVFVYDVDGAAFSVGDIVDIGGVTYTVQDVVVSGAADLTLHAEIRYLAEERRRALITPVPGVGSVLGVVASYDGSVVAFRDDGTGVVRAYKAASGWAEVPFLTQLDFSSGVSQISVGDTITGATSGATATVDEVIVTTGVFDATTPASGVLVLSNITGTFTAGESLDIGATTGVAVAATTQYTPAVSAAPDIVYYVYNFYGGADKVATYFIDRQSPTLFRLTAAGIVGVPVDTGGVPLAHIAPYKQRMYVSAGASILASVVGAPFKYDAVEGAAEIAVGGAVTNLVPERGTSDSSAIIVTTGSSTHVLYGDSQATWKLQTLSYDIGAIKDTAVTALGDVVFASESGIYTVQAVLEYGNFAVNAVSQNILPLYESLRPYITRAVVRADASEYRLMCSDGRMLVATQVKSVSDSGAVIKSLVFSLVTYADYETLAVPFTRVYRLIDASGTERFFAPGADYVYELDVGRSFDGAPIFAYFVTAFFYSRALLIRKRYKRVHISAISEGYSEFYVQYDVSPSAYDGGVGREAIVEAYPRGTWLDVGEWGKFVWNAGATPEFRVDTPGAGKALSIMIKSTSSISDPFTIQSFTVQFTVGRMER